MTPQGQQQLRVQASVGECRSSGGQVLAPGRQAPLRYPCAPTSPPCVCSVTTVRDFGLIFDALTHFEESLLAAQLANDEDPDQVRV